MLDPQQLATVLEHLEKEWRDSFELDVMDMRRVETLKRLQNELLTNLPIILDVLRNSHG